MNLDYYAKHKIREMQREANHRRLVQQVRSKTISHDRLFTGIERLGQQFIRLGTVLTNIPQSNTAVAQPECVTCA